MTRFDRVRIANFIAQPSLQTWARCAHVRVNERFTLWQAVRAVDPAFQRSLVSGPQPSTHGWVETPTAATVLLALQAKAA